MLLFVRNHQYLWETTLHNQPLYDKLKFAFIFYIIRKADKKAAISERVCITLLTQESIKTLSIGRVNPSKAGEVRIWEESNVPASSNVPSRRIS